MAPVMNTINGLIQRKLPVWQAKRNRLSTTAPLSHCCRCPQRCVRILCWGKVRCTHLLAEISDDQYIYILYKQLKQTMHEYKAKQPLQSSFLPKNTSHSMSSVAMDFHDNTEFPMYHECPVMIEKNDVWKFLC